MRLIIALSLLFTSSNLLANNLLSEEKPLCSSAAVRLSLVKIPCKLDLDHDGLFDIPELELDLEDLESLFEGAESSGGHVIGPMNHPRRTRPVTPFRIYLRCEAKLLAEAGKKVSFLSKQNLGLSATEYSTFLYADNWRHGIVQGATLNPSVWTEVQVTPKIEFKNYSVHLGYDEKTGKLSLTACEGDLKSTLLEAVAACSEVEFSRYSSSVKTRLKTLFIKQNLRIQKTLDITCRL